MQNKKTTLRLLPCIFDKDELLKMSKESMELALEIDRIESLKKNITPMRERITEISKKMKAGIEERQVLCDIIFDEPYPGSKTIIRQDTGEVVDVLKMTEEEMQGELGFSEPDPSYEVVEDDNVMDESRMLTSGYEIAENTESNDEVRIDGAPEN